MDQLPPVVLKVMTAAARLPDDSGRFERLKEVRGGGIGMGFLGWRDLGTRRFWWFCALASMVLSGGKSMFHA